jgi:hypothetical protein
VNRSGERGTNMNTQQPDSHPVGTTQLRVYWGEEDNHPDNRHPSKRDNDSQRKWAQREAFWAGRIPAGRLSARLAA